MSNDIIPQDPNPRQPKVKDIVPDDATILLDRITARLLLHHEHYGDSPTSVTTQFSQMCSSNNQQPWRRTVEVSPEKPQDISANWLEKPGTIVIENRAGMQRQIKLSAEQQAIEDQKIVYVFINGGDQPDTIIRPGRFVMFELTDPKTVRMESRSGVIPVIINIMPE